MPAKAAPHLIAIAERLEKAKDTAEIEPRDVHHVAVAAALAALHLSIESDTALKQLTIERDHYKKLAETGLRFTAPSMFVPAARED